MAYQSINPYNHKTLTSFSELTDKQLETVLELAATGASCPAREFRNSSTKSSFESIR